MKPLGRILLTALCASVVLFADTGAYCAAATAQQPNAQTADPYVERKYLYERMGALTGIPWMYLAAIDQYERTMTAANPKTRQAREGLTAIHYTEEQWAGPLNPDKTDRNPASIAFFHGVGKDGDGDGFADRQNDVDALYTMASRFSDIALSEEQFKMRLWDVYHNSRSVDRIMQFVRIYAAFDTLKLEHHAFPLPLRTDYSFRSTWGARRGWGGLRIHEGTDVFAHHGAPVRSTCYGIIEVQGWNRYGGWRVGIRSINNVYHYYAHLSGFDKRLQVGQVVEPGETIGWLGSSGYGKPGTQGKFPPHLHYGLYRDGGYVDWSFDPYPYLVRWEKEEARRQRAK